MTQKRNRQPLPDEVADALKRRGLVYAYEDRPAYQRNDYLLWIGQAKRDDSRRRRIAQMLDELEEGDIYMKMKWRPGAPASSGQASRRA